MKIHSITLYIYIITNKIFLKHIIRFYHWMQAPLMSVFFVMGPLVGIHAVIFGLSVNPINSM
jgi:hypothetical protein